MDLIDNAEAVCNKCNKKVFTGKLHAPHIAEIGCDKCRNGNVCPLCRKDEPKKKEKEEGEKYNCNNCGLEKNIEDLIETDIGLLCEKCMDNK